MVWIHSTIQPAMVSNVSNMPLRSKGDQIPGPHHIRVRYAHVGREEEGVEHIQLPQSGTQLRAFLGLANYFRRFLPGYAQIASPLYRKTVGPKRKTLSWTEEGRQAFERVKAAVQGAVVLKFIKPGGRVLPFHHTITIIIGKTASVRTPTLQASPYALFISMLEFFQSVSNNNTFFFLHQLVHIIIPSSHSIIFSSRSLE